MFPESLVERLHESTSFEPPNLHDRAGEEDLALLGAMELFRIVDVPDEAVVRLFAVYADAVRRLAKAEAKLYEANIEERLRASGMTERELIEFGTDFVSVNHVDAALEAEGIGRHIPQPPAICFVDLTGYTRLTEERGDRFAADVAAQLASLVRTFHASAAAARSGGLGDGGMFHFREPPRSVDAGLDMVEQAPAAGLPPAHIGIHAGPVIFQDGDVYGRTVKSPRDLPRSRRPATWSSARRSHGWPRGSASMTSAQWPSRAWRPRCGCFAPSEDVVVRLDEAVSHEGMRRRSSRAAQET